MAHRGLNRPTKPSGIWGHTEPTASAPPRPKRAGMTLWVDGTERSWNLLGELFSLKLQQSWFSFSSVIIPQQQHALGSSAIVKVSEQAGAAPKDIPPGSHKVPTRFQGSRQVPTRFPRFLQGSCKVPARFPRFPQLCSTRFPQLCSNVPTRFPTVLFHKVPTTLFHKVPTRFPPGSHKVPARFPQGSQGSCKVPARFPKFQQLCSTRFPQGARSFAPTFLRGSTILFHKVPTTLFHKVPTTLPHKVPPRFARFPQLCSKVPTRFPQLCSTTFPQLCPRRFPQGSQGSRKFAPRFPQLCSKVALVREEDLWTQTQQALKRAREDRQKKTTSTSTRAMDEVSTPSQAGGTSPMMGMRRAWSSSAAPGPQIPSAPAKDFWEDERRGYRLLKAAHLTKGERQNILTQTSNSEQH